MLTPQEVSGRAFSKAAFGGYNMAMVDEFLDEVTDDYTALYKENAALKAKLKVLVDKVEEYRATGTALLIATLVLGNVVFVIYDFLLKRLERVLAARKRRTE